MSRANSIANDPEISRMLGLPGFGRQPLTPQQQLDALKRVQSQAEQRVKLGMQLFKAAEARLSSQQDVLGQVKTLQKQLREQVNDDVAKSLHTYDQWIGQIDESFTTAIRKLEEKVDAVQANMVDSESRIQDMLTRAESLLDQSRCMIEQPRQAKPTPTKPDKTDRPVSAQARRRDAVAPSLEPRAKAPSQVGPHTVKNRDEKIYSTLLERLIQDTPDGQRPADQSTAA